MGKIKTIQKKKPIGERLVCLLTPQSSVPQPRGK